MSCCVFKHGRIKRVISKDFARFAKISQEFELVEFCDNLYTNILLFSSLVIFWAF